MRRLMLIALLAVCFLPATVGSHPGRLDKSGCHHVRKDFVYTSGKVVRRGEYHCHRLLSGERLVPAIILDGREVLMDSRKEIERDHDDAAEESP